jgi:hypothetical protein
MGDHVWRPRTTGDSVEQTDRFRGEPECPSGTRHTDGSTARTRHRSPVTSNMQTVREKIRQQTERTRLRVDLGEQC